MKTRSFVAVLATLLLSTGMLFSQNAGGGNPHGQASLAVPVSGTFNPSSKTSGSLASLGNGTLTGTFNINNFSVQNGQLVATGNLIATLTNDAGQVQTFVFNNVTTTLQQATGTCPILTLTLGPIDLDLLGLHVTTNQINLNIVAESGPGNLVGNLLCSVANLLNNGSPLSQIANGLNQLLAGLGL